MTYEQLKVLRAIVQEGTFRGASQRVFKSQPAISNLIKNLEAELGVQLFDRSAYRPVLTSAGRAIAEQAAIVLRETRHLKTLAGRFLGAEETEVSMAVNSIYPLPRLLKTLRRVEEAFPATQITLDSSVLGGPMKRLAESSADVALTYDDDLDPLRMESRYLDEVRIIPVSRPEYGPASRPGRSSRFDVRADVQVVISDPTDTLTHDVIAEARHWTVTDIASKKNIIMAGMGWGGLPEHEVAAELASGELVRVHVEGFEIRTSQLYLVRRTDRPVGVVAGALWDALLESDGREREIAR